MRERAAVFLDLDGVLVDNGPALRAAYGRAVGEVLRPILGGTHEAWAGALKAFLAAAPQPPVGLTPSETYRWEDVAGVTGPCGILGLTPPPEEECARLGRAIDRLVRLEYASFLPGAADAVRLLSAGRSVHMASGNAEWAVAGMLTRLGVRERVGVPCGADLVGVLKTSEGFYPRLFALSGVEAGEAIVVDDRAEVLTMASRAGAATVLVSRDAGPVDGIDLVVPSVAALAESFA